jgi:hypothetical protein
MTSRHTAIWAILILCIPLSVRSLRAADNTPTTRPTSQPATTAPATRSDPDFERGRVRAQKDLQAGIVAEILPIPEAFLMEWHDRQSEDHNLLDYYKAVLADKYNVKSSYVMFHAGLSGPRMYALGYNQEMRPAIEKRCGVETLNKAWKDACNLPTADRAKYLKDRAAKGPKSTTQPATPNPTPKD